MKRESDRSRRTSRLRWVLAVCLAALAAHLPTVPAAGSETIRLRLSWGGGEARQWRGDISLSQGEILARQPLGLEPDTPGSQFLSPSGLSIEQHSPQAYDACEIVVQAERSAKLLVSLAPIDDPTSVRPHEVAIGDLLNDFRHLPLDDRRNRMLVRRAPKDELQVRFSRDNLVFSPGEAFAFAVEPAPANWPKSATLQCELKLVDRDGEEVATQTHALATDAEGRAAPIEDVELDLPSREGVYTLKMAVAPRRLAASLVRPKPIATRDLQLVIVGSAMRFDLSGDSASASSDTWREALSIDPTNPLWWERLRALPQLKLWPALIQQPLGNGKPETTTVDKSAYLTMNVGTWQAYPLPVSRAGLPHVVEVTFPGNRPQLMGVSIVEPDAAGGIAPIHLDSGYDSLAQEVATSKNGEAAPVSRHRLVFWPRTKTPLLVLANRHDALPALFGKIRVLEGPERLPPRESVSAEMGKSSNTAERLLAVYFDKPLFPEAFGAPDALDEETGRALKDWETFYRGALRLAEYIKHAGYNGAVVTVVSEGSALYPSRLLDSASKYENGAYFSTGQDPVRKDVLEVLLRVFDAEGLTLIPAVAFSTPLPELEAARRENEDAATGLAPIGAAGRSFMQEMNPLHRLGVYYNPLDERVQDAVAKVVEELAARCADHASFGGVALPMGPETFMQLPGDTWGLDDRTFERFQKESKTVAPSAVRIGPNRFAARAAFVTGEGRDRWRTWRCENQARWRRELQTAIAASSQAAKLYMCPSDLLSCQGAAERLRPKLPLADEGERALLSLGVDPRLDGSRPGIVWLRPRRTPPLADPVFDAMTPTALARGNSLAGIDGAFDIGAGRGALHFQKPRSIAIESFDEARPLVKAEGELWLSSQFTPVGSFNRRRFVHSLAAGDEMSIVDGGWMPLFGQEDFTNQVFRTFRRLPAQPFATIAPEPGPSAPMVLRALTGRDATWLYIVNDSPHPAEFTAEIEAPLDAEVEALDGRTLPKFIPNEVWRLTLEPYDLVGLRFDSPKIRVRSWRGNLSEGAVNILAQALGDLRVRASALNSPERWEVLSNPGFEGALSGDEKVAAESRAIPGWLRAAGEGIDIAIDDSEAYEGRHSLRLKNRQNGAAAWVRSEPFDPPATGRIAVLVRLKGNNSRRQPNLRLAIEGRLHGQVYYRFANVGAGKDSPPLKTEWAQYILPIDDLPTQGLSDLRVGFDLMGGGAAFIDDVQVYRLWFLEDERRELLKSIAMADFQRDRGKLAECQQFIDGYWPQFLREHVPVSSQVASVDPTGPAAPEGEARPESKRRAVLENIQRMRKKMLRF